MYFPFGWPKIVDTSTLASPNIRKICCDRVKILYAILTDDLLSVWYSRPCLPIVSIRRTEKSISKYGQNNLVEWKPDSSMIVVVTDEGTLLLYALNVIDSVGGVYNQVDPPTKNLCRDSAELFVKDTIPALSLNLIKEVPLYVPVTCILCVNMTQMMVATRSEKIMRIRWDGEEERDYTLDLKRIPFSINQQVSYAVPIVEPNTYITSMDYSPLVGGFSITLNDGRAAFLTAGNLKFDPNQVQGIWAQNLDDATCTSINHRYRLIAFGRKNAQAIAFTIDELTGGLELSHTMIMSAKDFPGSPGAVREIKWSPDGCAVAISWSKGGVSLWSTFGTMLMCSLVWDYGLNIDLNINNPLDILCMDWSTEGYQLFMLRQQNSQNSKSDDDVIQMAIEATETTEVIEFPPPLPTKSLSIIQLNFLKSALAANPYMSFHSHLLLQGDDKLYINKGDSLQKVYYSHGSSYFMENNTENMFPLHSNSNSHSESKTHKSYSSAQSNGFSEMDPGASLQVTSILSESKHWVVAQLPTAYAATNWPIRYSAIDQSGTNVVVAGRTGIAIYSIITKKWKLFGNESQEKDFIVTGGLLWFENVAIMGCYSLLGHNDEIRCYPMECKLDNRYANIVLMNAPVMLINIFKNQLVVFTSEGTVTIFELNKIDSQNVSLTKLHTYDIRTLRVHPACIISINISNLRNDTGSKINHGPNPQFGTIILNVSGRILMVHKESNGSSSGQLTSTCLASCVECIWMSDSQKLHLKESLWFYCGGHGMRVWLPVFPRASESGHRSHRHTFMSKRIMLSFSLKVYPLVILFEDAIILGVENDTVLYTSDTNLHFSMPFCVLERTSQVYLHQILRQLIRRNLGYNAWEIARTCTHLPYFPHSLELLLHEVLEEEATSKEPIPDALLPSVLEFIQEFPVYLQTVVQCARKTEIALWPYLFVYAGKPKDLFQQCLITKQLETASSYLIILQNLEPSVVSRQYATLLLDTSLQYKKWELAKDLVRFLRAIDPNDVESPRSSFIMGNKLGMMPQSPPVIPNAEDLSLILGPMARGRSFSTTMNPKSPDSLTLSPGLNSSMGKDNKKTTTPPIDTKSVLKRKKSAPNTPREKNASSAEDFFIEVILQRHARHLLQEKRLEDLGYMSATLDFHLVGWLARETDRAARIEDFVTTLKQLHDDLNWPKPNLDLEFNRRGSSDKQQNSPSYSLQSLRIDANMRTVDSGYTSLQKDVNASEITQQSDVHLSSVIPGPTIGHDRKISMQQMIAETSASSVVNSVHLDPMPISNNQVDAMAGFDTASIASEQVSLWDDDTPSLLNQEIDKSFNKAMESLAIQHPKTVPHKLEVKIRYLLQIFTEAGCLEFSLLLSILLLDAASVCRVTNSAIRSGSLAVCRQLRNGLKDITRWSFQECLGYRPFMMALQSQISLLDRYVIQQESIPNFPNFQDDVTRPENTTDDSLSNTQPLSTIKEQPSIIHKARNDAADTKMILQRTTSDITSRYSKSKQSDPEQSALPRSDSTKEDGSGCVLM